jgi:hypothetical protein
MLWPRPLLVPPLLVLCCLVGLLVNSAAEAAMPGRIASAAPAAKPLPNLRGTQTAPRPVPVLVRPTLLTLATPYASPMTPRPGYGPVAEAGAGSQCRLSCAQSYYFCLASDSPEHCPGSFSQCANTCASVFP